MPCAAGVGVTNTMALPLRQASEGTSMETDHSPMRMQVGPSCSPLNPQCLAQAGAEKLKYMRDRHRESETDRHIVRETNKEEDTEREREK